MLITYMKNNSISLSLVPTLQMFECKVHIFKLVDLNSGTYSKFDLTLPIILFTVTLMLQTYSGS